MSPSVVFVAGSPAAASKSSLIARAVASHLEQAGVSGRLFSFADFDPADVLYGRVHAPSIARFIETLSGASAVVLSTPVYKATYTGGLKALVDLIPPDALVGVPALGIATAKVEAHGAEVDRAYRALFAFFRARTLDTLFALDGELRAEGGETRLGPVAEQRARSAALGVLGAIEDRRRASQGS